MVPVHDRGKPVAGQPRGVALTGRGYEGETPSLREKYELLPRDLRPQLGEELLGICPDLLGDVG